MSNSVRDQKTLSPRGRWGPPEASGLLEKQKSRRGDLKAAMERGIRKYPLAMLVAGFALGAVVGWFIKRR